MGGPTRESELELALARLEARIHELHALCDYVATADRRFVADYVHDSLLESTNVVLGKLEQASRAESAEQGRALAREAASTVRSMKGKLAELLAELDPLHLDAVEDLAEAIRDFVKAVPWLDVVIRDELDCVVVERVRVPLHRIAVTALRNLFDRRAQETIEVWLGSDQHEVVMTISGRTEENPFAGRPGTEHERCLRLIEARCVLIGGRVTTEWSDGTATIRVSLPRPVAEGQRRLLELAL